MATRGGDSTGLVNDLRKQATLLEDDLRARSEEVTEFDAALRAEYDAALDAKRIAATYESWRDDRITQVAAAWVLGTVFVRFCEDNGLIEWPFIAGPGERLADAEERHEAFFKEHPQLNDRDWLIEAFNRLSATNPTVAGLFDKQHNALWEISPSFEAASALLAFWRRRDDNGEIRYDFTDPELDTRFLGDLYQDLSEHARKTYALLQTPVFVEEFILDLTLEPAVEEFGLTGLRTIDPACGSGHFLLGIFDRLLAKWRAAEPGTNDWDLIRRSLDSVHGCDKNPFAVSIARFRLLVAVMKASDERRLDRIPEFRINIAVGDSLMHGKGVKNEQMDLLASEDAYTYRTEDVAEFIRTCDLLTTSSYHVVVGNPPYIAVKDTQENENYRERYNACSGAYALSVPFAQRLFQLAIRDDSGGRLPGFVGQITANSFMKREFGRKLIEQFFPTVTLTHIIDTSGAYIPEHGTPTIILIGRNLFGRKTNTVRTVLSIRGEPSPPLDPAKGLVWSSIVAQTGAPNSQSEWTSSADLDRLTFSRYPWSLSGGGSADVVRTIEANTLPLGNRVSSIGRTTATGADDAYFLPNQQTAHRLRETESTRKLIVGEAVRDYRVASVIDVRTPYTDHEQRKLSNESSHLVSHGLWPYRSTLMARIIFGKTLTEKGCAWYCHLENYSSKLTTDSGINFSFVATHNHFTFDQLGRLSNRTAPVIKLHEGASEDDHLALLGVLNSSTACFWLKQVCQDKGNRGGERSTGRYAWENYYEFTGTKLQEFPLPERLPLELGRTLDSLAQQLAAREPSAVSGAATPTRGRLDGARDEQQHLLDRMIALQEELDWQVYGSYSLLGETEAGRLISSDAEAVPEIKLGERAFEIVLARKVAAGEADSEWFARHRSTPITEIPDHWPEWYRDIVQARIDIIEKRRDIALIERPECKRRWATQPWEKREAEALRTWLLDRCEEPDLWFSLRDGIKQPRALTVSQLADRFRDDADMHSVAQLYARDHLGKPDLTLAQVLESVVADQHVPYLAAQRYQDSGLRKRAQWERVWDQQREEDRTGKRLDIAVPPKYAQADFRKPSFWHQRGKLDVPKERFISYPGASPDADPTLLLGWAGWDHKDQAQTLVNVINDRVDQAGWDTDRVEPLLAGLLEVMPWVRQWHGEYDADWGGTPAEEYQAYLEEQRATRGLTEEALRAWRPAAPTRGRRAKKVDQT